MSEDDARHTPDPSHAQEHDGLDEMIDTLRELVTLERERLNVAPRLAEVALPDALLRLADALGDAERYEEALAVGDEAVARWTALREDPGERGPQFASRCARRLAEALYLQSYYLDELGRYEAAREAAERELALRHELARAGADDGRYDLAAAYNNLSNALQGLERDADELAARREALALRRALA
ncbi:MAG: hypothetical protein KC468_01080, partial [Myxococcales bacterium]|nr:hypothetical protein [Myxococcales bacterium]